MVMLKLKQSRKVRKMKTISTRKRKNKFLKRIRKGGKEFHRRFMESGIRKVILYLQLYLRVRRQKKKSSRGSVRAFYFNILSHKI
jgi:hypothetical protein